MVTQISLSLSSSQYNDPANRQRFFATDLDTVEAFEKIREQTQIGAPGKSCESNLFLGFFFDGTRNNYAVSEKAGDHTHSNVARLFDAYPGQTIAPAVMLTPQVKWPDEANYPNYFRIYMPGVGTPFDELGDNGAGVDRIAGAAFALWGQRRLAWALGQAINALHRYFHRAPLLSNAEILNLARKLELDARSLKARPIFIDLGRAANTKAHLQQVLYRLHQALRPHMPDPKTRRPAKIDPCVVKEIYVSTFGFSRGATAARVFTNWFLALCELDAHMLGRSGKTLGGFPVVFDFLGIFDTVASVGSAASMVHADGHEGWADAEVSLRIPPGVKCTHLVSAHEVRRSFPLDSISVNGILPDGCREIVFPGVHSDIGGGYTPKEQGRGKTEQGEDMLSRIPLAVMYREARLNGAPLKLERCRTFVHDRFRIDPRLIQAFNAYLAAAPSPGKTLREIMRHQMQLAILWRKAWVGRMASMPSVRRAPQVDINDIVGADREFVDELKHFENWRKEPNKAALVCANPVLGTCTEIEESRIPGYDPGRFAEWPELNSFWRSPPVPAATAHFFENYVHDSRAWFKVSPGAWEAADVEAGLKKWAERYDDLISRGINPRNTLEPSVPFTTEEIGWIEHYRKTKKIPAMKTSGREPFELGAGYLRFRRIYAGGDRLLLTRHMGTADASTVTA